MSRGVRLLHISDVHFGKSYVAAHVAAAEALAAERFADGEPLDAIVVSGDLSQRARVHEFEAARALIARLQSLAPTLVVPGNHDTQWWRAPFGLGAAGAIHERYRAIISPETEPTLRVPGVTIVGMDSSGGMLPRTLTWYPRDWRVKGGVTDAQLDHASARFAAAPAGDLRVLVLHHNVVRGELSNRWGLARPRHALARIAAMDVDVVCTGHDHTERAELVSDGQREFLVSTANTLSTRSRGKRVASLNMVRADAHETAVEIWHFDAKSGAFALARKATAPRRLR